MTQISAWDSNRLVSCVDLSNLIDSEPGEYFKVIKNLEEYETRTRSRFEAATFITHLNLNINSYSTDKEGELFLGL